MFGGPLQHLQELETLALVTGTVCEFLHPIPRQPAITDEVLISFNPFPPDVRFFFFFAHDTLLAVGVLKPLMPWT